MAAEMSGWGAAAAGRARAIALEERGAEGSSATISAMVTPSR